MTIDTTDLQTRAAALGIALNNQQLDQFSRFSTLLSDWNEKLNLTAVPIEEYVERHFLDSLSLVTSAAWNPAATVIDVGTGAGFPGIPLKIAFPEIKLTLLESLNKRCVFLAEAVRVLNLGPVSIVSERGEISAHSPQLRETFDIVCARAVANMSVLAEILLPYAKVGGALIVLKGIDISEELVEAEEPIRVCGGDAAIVQQISLPASNRSLTIVTSTKIKNAPARVPRSYAAISRKPLRESREKSPLR